MSFMKGDLLTKTRKLVKGLAKAEPIWLKAMEQAPPAIFPRAESKIKPISLPEDVYIKKFFKKYPESKYEDAIKIMGFDPPAARVFGMRVLELKEQGISEEKAMAVADMEYRAERKAKKKAYSRLKQIAKIQGKRPPPNPYASPIKEIQAEERKFVIDRFNNPKILELVQKMKEERAAEMQERDRMRPPAGERNGGNVQFTRPPAVQFTRPPAVQFSRPPAGQFSRPPASQFSRPPGGERSGSSFPFSRGW